MSFDELRAQVEDRRIAGVEQEQEQVLVVRADPGSGEVERANDRYVEYCEGHCIPPHVTQQRSMYSGAANFGRGESCRGRNQEREPHAEAALHDGSDPRHAEVQIHKNAAVLVNDTDKQDQ